MRWWEKLARAAGAKAKTVDDLDSPSDKPLCPSCDMPLDAHPAIVGLFVCHLCELSWNPVNKLARALRGPLMRAPEEAKVE